MVLNTRERILTIRLMEKVKANPAQGKALGIEIIKGPVRSGRQKVVSKL